MTNGSIRVHMGPGIGVLPPRQRATGGTRAATRMDGGGMERLGFRRAARRRRRQPAAATPPALWLGEGHLSLQLGPAGDY
jgi:hypothetical protein